MSYYELHGDVNILYGGLWFDPDGGSFVEVIDMESAAGVEGAHLVEEGRAFLSDKVIREGAQAYGQADQAENVIALVSQWDGIKKFASLPKPVQNAVLLAAEWVYGYMGMDGGPEQMFWVIDKSSSSKTFEEVKDVPPDWVVVTKNPKAAILKILRNWGVKVRRSVRMPRA